MIVVIADDLTGAAELGAVCLRYGLAAEVQIDRFEASPADLIVLDTDTRSLTAEQAAAVVREAAHAVRDAGPDWTYKKVDSVLRGPVRAELEAMMDAFESNRVLLVPANPSMGRSIRGGTYFVHDRPLHETDFANDPEHPAHTSDVLAMLGPGHSAPCAVLAPGTPLPPEGIVVGDVSSADDLAAWADRVEGNVIPAGGAEFFAALLEARGCAGTGTSSPETTDEDQALFVSGSTSTYSRRIIDRARNSGVCVVTVPPGELAEADLPPEAMERWVNATVSGLETDASVVVTIGGPLLRRPGSAATLSRRLAEIVAAVLDRHDVENLYVEGGTTATAVARQLGWHRFTVQGEPAPGTVSMQVAEPPHHRFTLKPGSYPWPASLAHRLAGPRIQGDMKPVVS